MAPGINRLQKSAVSRSQMLREIKCCSGRDIDGQLKISLTFRVHTLLRLIFGSLKANGINNRLVLEVESYSESLTVFK